MKNWICAVILVISLSFSGTCLSSQSSGLNAIFNGQKPDIKLVKEKLSLLTEYTTGKFKDIRSTDWFCPGTSKLVGMGGVEGYTDGTFKPQNPIKVSEFVKLLLSSMGYKEENHPQVWYKNYVDKATALGVIEPSDAYAYESGMKRMDMAKMICRILNIQPKKSPAPVFSDTSGIDTSWIDTAFSEYLIRGYYSKHSRTFKPTQTASRAEVCEMIVRALEYRDNPAEYKRYMAAHFAEAEKRQDDLDDGALQNINGFVTKVPGRNSAL
ncbi:MAG: S-layer homology domain-containing protein, partial [Clostridia bacterium]|nr:S-layer homology domain-containing protein [Clostridia bacterium]